MNDDKRETIDLMTALRNELIKNDESPAGADSLEDMANRYADLEAKKFNLQAQLDRIKDEMRAIEEPLLEKMMSASCTQVKVAGTTVHIREEIWPALVVPDGMTDEEARFSAVKTLIELGHTRQVNYNSQSMRALVREMMDDDGELPSPLGDFVKADIRHRIGVRGARGRSIE